LPEAVAGVSTAEATDDATGRLVSAGCDTPRLDAELLMAEVLGVGRERLVMNPDRGLEPEELARFNRLVARREAREPIAYILGRKGFRRLTLAVDPRVLIPRPETELLVEVGVELPSRSRVVDLGTGSGAVALALKHERPDLEVWASDIAGRTLEVARRNARDLGLDVTFVQADLLTPIGAEFDAVLSNLPYVETGAELAPEITLYEPTGALFAGEDGLEVIRRLVGQLAAVPLVALEVGARQAPTVQALLRGVGFGSLEKLRDLGGHERVVVGRR
jgi:release factor glutamine methyltransferase